MCTPGAIERSMWCDSHTGSSRSSTRSTVSDRSIVTSASSKSPRSRRAKSNRSWTRPLRAFPLVAIRWAKTWRSWSENASHRVASIDDRPEMAVAGVRSSCEATPRKAVLSSSSASSRATASCCCSRLRAETIVEAIISPATWTRSISLGPSGAPATTRITAMERSDRCRSTAIVAPGARASGRPDGGDDRGVGHHAVDEQVPRGLGTGERQREAGQVELVGQLHRERREDLGQVLALLDVAGQQLDGGGTLLGPLGLLGPLAQGATIGPDRAAEQQRPGGAERAQQPRGRIPPVTRCGHGQGELAPEHPDLGLDRRAGHGVSRLGEADRAVGQLPRHGEIDELPRVERRDRLTDQRLAPRRPSRERVG